MSGPGYEHSDVEVRNVLWFGLSLCLMLVVVSVVTHELQLRFYGLLSAGEPRAKERPLPERTATRLVPVQPLQGTPRYSVYGPAELEAIRRQEELLMSTYGCVDRQRGTVRIPIQAAMQLLVDQGQGQGQGQGRKTPESGR